MLWKQLATNPVLHAVLISWFLAQFIKVLIELVRTHQHRLSGHVECRRNAQFTLILHRVSHAGNRIV